MSEENLSSATKEWIENNRQTQFNSHGLEKSDAYDAIEFDEVESFLINKNKSIAQIEELAMCILRRCGESDNEQHIAHYAQLILNNAAIAKN